MWSSRLRCSSLIGTAIQTVLHPFLVFGEGTKSQPKHSMTNSAVYTDSLSLLPYSWIPSYYAFSNFFLHMRLTHFPGLAPQGLLFPHVSSFLFPSTTNLFSSGFLPSHSLSWASSAIRLYQSPALLPL